MIFYNGIRRTTYGYKLFKKYWADLNAEDIPLWQPLDFNPFKPIVPFLQPLKWNTPVSVYLLKVNNRNTRASNFERVNADWDWAKMG